MLEAELGITLFDRLPRGVRLSEAGREFLPDAKRIMDDVGRAMERMQRFIGRTGTIRVGMSVAVAGHRVVTEAIRTFHSLHPEIELSLCSIELASLSRAILDGRVDVGFAYRWPEDSPKIGHHEIDRVNLMGAISASHRLAGRDRLTLAELAEEPLICVSRSISPRPYDKLMEACRDCNLVPRIAQEATSTVILDLVSAGMGIGIISGAMEPRLPHGVVLRPVIELSTPTPFDVMWRIDPPSLELDCLIGTIIAIVDGARPVPVPRETGMPLLAGRRRLRVAAGRNDRAAVGR